MIEYTIPNMPRFPGESFDMSIYANTGGYALKIWGVQFNFNTSVLAWVQGSFAVSALYSPPLLVTDVPGVLIASVSLAPSSPESAVTSQQLLVANVSFGVQANAHAGIWAGAISCQIIGMLNTGGNQYVTNKAAQILDLQGGYVESGAIPVANLQPLGIYAFPGVSELVNWAALGAQRVSTSLQAAAVYNRYGITDSICAASCSLAQGADPNIVTIFSCDDIGPTANTLSAGMVQIKVTCSTLLSTTVAMRVWSPQSVSVLLQENVLNRIAGSEKCGISSFQRTLCSAMAVFSLGDPATQSAFDVSDVVTFSSTDPNIASVTRLYGSGSVQVTGVSVGVATLSISGATVRTVSAQITVVDDLVRVLGLSVTLLSRVLWGPFPASLKSNDVAQYLGQVTLLSEQLTSNVPNAALFVTGHFSDGANYLVTKNDGVTLSSANANVLNISDSTDHWTAQRMVNGELSQCGPLAVASWTICQGNVATGYGVVNVDLPPPISATMTLTSAFITSSRDPWALPPRSFPTSSTFKMLVVTFADGAIQSFPPSSRTVFRIVSGNALVALQGFTVTSAGTGSGFVTIVASMAGMGNVSAKFQIFVSNSAATSANLGCSYSSCGGIALTSPRDAASQQPFNFPTTYSSFTVIVSFADGTQTDYSADSRWQMVLVEGGQFAVVSEKQLKATGTGAGQVTLQAQFLGQLDLNSTTTRINIVTSAAVGVSLSCIGQDCTQAKLSPPGNPAASPPIGYPISLRFSITVKLLNGAAVLLPYDQRTVYQILPVGAMVTMAADTLSVNSAVNISGTVSVRASFPGTFNLSTQAIQITIVVLQSLSLQLSHSSGGKGNGSVLQRIQCSQQFQASDITIIAALSDGLVRDVTSYSLLVSSNPSAVSITGTRALGLVPGSAELRGTFAGVQSKVGILVSNSSVRVSQVILQGLSGSFVDAIGATKMLSLYLTFDDSSLLTLSQQAATWTWIVPANLLRAIASFSSDSPAALSVGPSTGTLQLNGNWYTNVTTTVYIIACESSSIRTATIVTSPNVIPYSNSSGDGDVDIGNAAGLPVNPIRVGVSATLPIYLRSDGQLKSFEILLYVDDSMLAITGCTSGVDWTGGFSCSINDPVGTIFLIGADITSTSMGQRINIGKLQVVAKQAGVTSVSGIRVKVASSLSSNLCPRCKIIAGNILLLTLGGVSRRIGYSVQVDAGIRQPASLNLQNPRATARRSLLQSGRLIYGDVDGDGKFDTSDCLMTQEYFTNIRLGTARYIGCAINGGNGCRLVSSLTDWQLKQMDQVSDPKAPPSVADYRDFNFMLQIYSNNERFFVDWNYTNDQIHGLSIRVLIMDRTSQPAIDNCGVRFILATSSNRNILFDTNSTLTTEGILVAGKSLGQGWYGIQSRTPMDISENIPFVFMIETVDGNGQGSTDRRFPFYSTDLPPYNAYYVGFSPFSILYFIPLSMVSSSITNVNFGKSSTPIMTFTNTSYPLTPSIISNFSILPTTAALPVINTSIFAPIGTNVLTFYSTPAPFTPTNSATTESYATFGTNISTFAINASTLLQSYETFSTTTNSIPINLNITMGASSLSTFQMTFASNDSFISNSTSSNTTETFASNFTSVTDSSQSSTTVNNFATSATPIQFNISNLPPISLFQSYQSTADKVILEWSYPAIDSLIFHIIVNQCQDSCNVSFLDMNINATSCTFYGTSLSWKCAYTLADVQISRYLVNLAAILAQNGAQSPLLTTIFSVAYYPDSPTSLRIDQYGTALPRTSTIYFSWYLNETVSLDSPMSAYIDSFSLEASCECQQESLCTIPYVSQSFLLGPSESEYYFYAVWAQNNIASISPQSQGTSFAFSKK